MEKKLRICKRCLIRDLAEEDQKDLKKYLDRIRGEDRAEETVYEARLQVCRACERGHLPRLRLLRRVPGPAEECALPEEKVVSARGRLTFRGRLDIIQLSGLSLCSFHLFFHVS